MFPLKSHVGVFPKFDFAIGCTCDDLPSFNKMTSIDVLFKGMNITVFHILMIDGFFRSLSLYRGASVHVLKVATVWVF